MGYIVSFLLGAIIGALIPMFPSVMALCKRLYMKLYDHLDNKYKNDPRI